MNFSWFLWFTEKPCDIFWRFVLAYPRQVCQRWYLVRMGWARNPGIPSRGFDQTGIVLGHGDLSIEDIEVFLRGCLVLLKLKLGVHLGCLSVFTHCHAKACKYHDGSRLLWTFCPLEDFSYTLRLLRPGAPKDLVAVGQNLAGVIFEGFFGCGCQGFNP